MNSAATFLRGVAVVALVTLAPLAAWAQGDPPGRVGRVADLQGSVSIFDHEQGQWEPAQRNRPLTQGDRLATDGNARGELRIGSSTLRLGGSSELEVLRLDDERVVVQLHSGQLALRIRSRDVAAETEVITAEVRLRPLRSGHFRIDRLDDNTTVSNWRGELRVGDDTGNGETFVIDSGRRAELWREGPQRELRHSWLAEADDDFSRWAQREDQGDERTASNRYVSPEMTGAEDLDRNGRWEQSSEHGAVWIPTSVQADWAPYRYGRWAWVPPWGWTWVDDASWGFAPFHYGRWVSWGGRWCWTPGAYAARPVYAPALVAWVGGPRAGVSIGIGGPAVGWVPLAPREVFVPWYRASPEYGHRVNHEPPGRQRRPAQVPTGPIMYGNQGVPGAVTVVPRDVLMHRRPVAGAVMDVREPMRHAPPPVPVMVAPPGPAATVFPGRPAMRPSPAPVEIERSRAPRELPQPVTRMPASPVSSVPQVPQVPQVAPASPAAPPAVEFRRAPARAPVPVLVPAPAPAPAPVRVPAPTPAPAPAPAAVPPPVPAPHAAAQPAPVTPVAPVVAKPRPPETREAPKEESRPRSPESRNNMRDREQVR
jgi:hypothetical protein